MIDANDTSGSPEIGSGGITGAAATSMQKDDQADAAAERKDATHVEAQEGKLDYAGAGAAFTGWFNDKLRQLPNPSVTLGTKQAHAIALHPDGRLECVLVGATTDEDARQFVAFEGQYLDQLVRRIGALGL